MADSHGEARTVRDWVPDPDWMDPARYGPALGRWAAHYWRAGSALGLSLTDPNGDRLGRTSAGILTAYFVESWAFREGTEQKVALHRHYR